MAKLKCEIRSVKQGCENGSTLAGEISENISEIKRYLFLICSKSWGFFELCMLITAQKGVTILVAFAFLNLKAYAYFRKWKKFEVTLAVTLAILGLKM